MRRRSFLRSGLGAFGATGLWSCARTPRSSGPTALRIGAGADRYNTSKGRFTFTSSRPNLHVAEPPVRPDESFDARPWLFERWSHDGGGNYTARLRSGVAFHDGSPLDANAFIASARRFLATRDFIGLDSESLRRIDEITVAFRSLTGSAALVKNMTHPAASLFLANGREDVLPIGTGPYRLARYEPRRLVEVERFERYWGSPPPNERIQFRFIADPQARLMALRTGQVDLISDVTAEMFLGLAPDEPAVAIRQSRPMRYVALLCNLRGEPPFDTLGDIRVRRALALAIDRESIARVMYGGRAAVARGVLPDWMFGLGGQAPQGFELNREMAAELLEQAGWRLGEDGFRSKAGRPLQLRLVAAFPNASAVKPMPEMLEQMFRAVGARTEIVEVEDDQLYYSGYADQGQGDLFLEMGGNAVADPTFLLHNTYHSKTPWPAYRYSAPGPDVDGLLDAARDESNDETIVQLVREAHRRIIDEHICSIPILLVPVFLLTRPDVVLEPFESLDWIDFGAAQRTA